MTFVANPTTGEDPWDVDANARFDDLQAHIEALEAQGPPSAGTEYIDCSAAPYSMVAGVNYQGGDGTARNGSDATRGFRKAVHDAVITGKELWIPPGIYDMRMTTAGHPNALIFVDMTLKQRRVKIRGCGEGVTVLDWSNATLGTVTDPTDLVLGGDPSGRIANFAIDVWMSNNTNTSIDLSDLTLLGPGHYTAVFAPEQRADGWGIRMGGRARVQRVEVTGFHTAVCYRMRGGASPTTQDHNIDHNTLRDCNLHDNYYNQLWNYYWPRSGANSGDGDHVIDNVMMSQAAKACRAVDPYGVAFDSKIASCHGGFSPYGWYSELGPQAPVKLDGTDPHASAAGTVARDAAGIITIDTKIAAYAPPWGVFDNSDKPWNHGTVVACGGFIPGDVLELDDVAAAGHAAGSLATDTNTCYGRIQTKVGTVITVLMENPVAGSAFGPLTITAGSLTSHYAQQRMLDSNVEHDGTYEGCGNSNLFAPNRAVYGYGSPSQLPFHSLMSVDNNKGTDNAYSSIPMLSLARANLTHPGQTHASNGDIMLVTGVCPTGTPMGPGDNWFINTPTAGAFQDDNPPTGSWQPENDRIRGMANILTVVDNGTTCTFTFRQTASAKNNYTEKTLGDGTATSWDPTGHPAHGSAGGCGRCAGFVVQIFEDHQGPTFDITAHPPDSSVIGGQYAAVELVVSQMHRCRFHMLQPTAFYPRLMQGVPDISTEPVRSLCLLGDIEVPITHVTAAVKAGDVVEFAGKDDIRPFQGGTAAGVALWDRPTTGDYNAYIREGILRPGDNYPVQGVRSLLPFAQDDDIYADEVNHGLATDVTTATANEPPARAVVGRCSSNSTQSFTTITAGVGTDTAADTITKTAHGLISGRRIFLTGLSGTTGIANNKPYYVVNPTTNAFQVALTENGSPIALAGTNDSGLTVASLYTTSLRVDIRNPIA